MRADRAAPQRGGEIIEPLISKQWFVNTDGMARWGWRPQRPDQKSCLSASRKSTTIGWRTCARGASAASSGGDIASLVVRS